MDANDYLRKQGWLGDGHPLDHTGKGIKKPLLVSKKVDVLGVGLNKHAAVSDQWWLRAYDQGLKDFGTGKENLLGQVQKHGVSRGGLYGRFVKGDAVPGTIGTSLGSTPTGIMTPVERVEELQEDMVMLETEAPAYMAEGTSKKRKRDDKEVERAEKRARRKLEKAAQKIGQQPRSTANSSTPEPQAGQSEVVITADLSTGRGRALERNRQARIAKKLRHGMNPEERQAFRDEQRVERKQRKSERARAGPAIDKGLVKAPLFGIRTRPLTVAERLLRQRDEQEKIDRYRAAKLEMSLVRYRRAVAAGELQDSSIVAKKNALSIEKLKEYTKRAHAKGVSIEEYMKRREEKYAVKQGGKLYPDPAALAANDLGFVVDTAGDDTLAADPPAKRNKDNDLLQLLDFTIDTANNYALATDLLIERTKATEPPQLPDFANALTKIANNEPVLITGPDGTETFRWDPSMPVPHDLRLWQGVIVKQLPKLVRKARKDWMAVQRAERKLEGHLRAGQEESERARMIGIREDLTWRILLKSRLVVEEAGQGGETPGEVRPDVEWLENVPLVAITPAETFSKREIMSARTVAAHILGMEMLETKAKMGNQNKQPKQPKAKKTVARPQPSEVRTDAQEATDLLLGTVATSGEGEVASTRAVATQMVKVEKRKTKARKGKKETMLPKERKLLKEQKRAREKKLQKEKKPPSKKILPKKDRPKKAKATAANTTALGPTKV
ncbi:hypothetical protein LTR91_013375 [Friedmanniomyces endolithicus]|uniref:G-patch domain-containing protein n=1 Tax=Friedmanniomyces endolithicus TaxID=329885 RepID=A0AAN6KDR8_9PEZI|nr:hypothetical protein LTR35_015797 [Friedmanniomyces endolithicus]KAK0275843.1 hypothetical protein LTS00_014876 [Friedmanniomyces endolithicus]KAK0910834.1 hypothetical protein LTR57_015646 [Friedmanniomyces endolithicus]KAK0973026.1 hypothetical protein LTS01_014740 [Friedmanniomyces endolithicus]KAK0977221.1 hypothetical protein LTR91_013375 [Friedmanniomyces endolithicus]